MSHCTDNETFASPLQASIPNENKTTNVKIKYDNKKEEIFSAVPSASEGHSLPSVSEGASLPIVSEGGHNSSSESECSVSQQARTM